VTTPAIDEGARAAVSTVRLSISGMTCEHCRRHVTEALTSIAGVASATVDLEGSTATVELAAPPAPVVELRRAVEDAGYGADVLEVRDPER
jgi:copper chaperone CopZ